MDWGTSGSLTLCLPTLTASSSSVLTRMLKGLARNPLVGQWGLLPFQLSSFPTLIRVSVVSPPPVGVETEGKGH